MGVYIKNIKMPSNCDDCHFNIDCPYDESQDGYKMMVGRPRKCPLIPVPPHGGLIDVDKLSDRFYEDYFRFDADAIMDYIQANAPTIIPAEEE